MAEIVDQLRLDIAQALRDIDRVEASLDRAFAPVEIEIDVDTRSTEELASTLREVERIAERAATETQSIALAAGRAEVNFEDVARALNISEDAARDLSTEILQAQAAANRLEDSARDVARQLGLSETETHRFVNELRRADRAAEGINVRTGSLVAGFATLRTTAAAVAAVLGGIGLGAGFAAVGRGAQVALREFQALNESVNAVQVTFGSASEQVLNFGRTSAEAAGLSASAFQQSVVPLGAVLTNFGFSANEAADASITLVQRAADLASVFNTDVAEALLAINSALVGQVEPLRRYGAEISQARVEAFALANGLADANGNIDDQAATLARVQLILADTSKVQGDFANTSDQLANAQRIAAAEAQDFAAEVGEALAPAMAALVDVLPEVLEGVRQLVPAFVAGADSAAAFFEAVGEDGGAGFRTFGAGARELIGLSLDVSGGVRDMGAAFGDLLVGDLAGASTALDRFRTRFERSGLRTIGTQMARELDRGSDATEAFNTAVLTLGQRISAANLDTFEQGFRDFAIAAGLSQRELLEVTGNIIATGTAAGLSADELSFLEDQFALLRNTLFPVGNEVAQANQAMADLGETTRTRLVPALEQIQVAAAAAGLSLGDLLAGVDPIAAGLLESLTPADELALRLDAVRTGALTTAEAFSSNLAPSLIDVRQGLEDLNRNGRVSMNEFITNLANTRVEFLQFMVDIAAIANVSPELAAALQALGPEAAGELAEGFADLDPADIIARARAAGLTDTFEDAVLGIFVEGIGQVNGNDPKAVAAYIGLIDDLFGQDIPGVAKVIAAGFQPALNASFADLTPPNLDPIILGSVEGLNAAQLTAALNPVLDASFGDLEFPDVTPQMTSTLRNMDAAEIAAAVEASIAGGLDDVDFFDEGRAMRATLIDGLSTRSSGETGQLRQSLQKTLDAASQKQSPPKLFMDAGIEAGEAFWMGFEQSDLNLRAPIPSFTGTVTSGKDLSKGDSSFTFSPTYVNTETKDLETVVARSEQLMSSVAGILNGRFKL